MKLIKINNNNVELAEGVLLVPEFEKIYKDKKNYIDYFKAIFLYADFTSAYKNYSEEQRVVRLENDLKIKFDKDLLAAIDKFKDMSYTFNMRFLESNINVMNKTMKFYDTVNYDDKDDNGKPIHTPKAITDAVKNCAAVMQTLELLKDKVNAEQLTNSKVRGNANIRKREE